MQAMASTEAITAHRRIRTGDLHRDQIDTLQGQQPANRSAEALASRSPAHEASALKTIDPGWDELLQKINAVLPLGPHACEHTFALGGIAHLELRRIHTAAFGKADRSWPRNPILEGLGDWRPLTVFFEVRLEIRQTMHPNHQPTGCAQYLNRLVIETAVPQITTHTILQLIKGLTGEIGR